MKVYVFIFDVGYGIEETWTKVVRAKDFKTAAQSIIDDPEEGLVTNIREFLDVVDRVIEIDGDNDNEYDHYNGDFRIKHLFKDLKIEEIPEWLRE